MFWKTPKETLDIRVILILSNAIDRAKKVINSKLTLQNSVVLMVEVGAKKSCVLNPLGQQTVRGKRPHRGYRGRVLSHFKRDDLSARARGFIVNSYKRGLTPQELFFHAINSRDELLLSEKRMSESGYMYRRLVNALQDLRVEYDGTVRDARGIIVQFRYGEDGVDPTKSWRGKAVDIDRAIIRVLGGSRIHHENMVD